MGPAHVGAAPRGEETATQVGASLQSDDTVCTEDPALAEIAVGTVVFCLGSNPRFRFTPA